MTWPVPVPGLVIRYSYLWATEHAAGREEGTKDRPCAIILATHHEQGALRIIVLPVTHTPPSDPTSALEIPAEVKRRLGLDDDRSWIVVSEGNEFTWPGPDLRPFRNDAGSTIAYGLLPRGMTLALRRLFLDLDQKKKFASVQRTE